MNFRFFIYFLAFLLISCTNVKKNNDKLYTKIYDILYQDDSKNYYFQYSIPKRIKKDNVDIGETVFVYDSLVNLNDSIVVINNIINLNSLYKTNEGQLADRNFIYIENETNIKPKFSAHKKDNRH